MRSNTELASVLLLLVLVSWMPVNDAQFFTKTSKSVPRLGRRGDAAFEALLQRAVLGEEMTPVGRLFHKYDVNGDWCLSPDEVWDIPSFRMREDSSRPPAAPSAQQSPSTNGANSNTGDSIQGFSSMNKK